MRTTDDKSRLLRFALTAGAVAAVLALHAIGRPPGEQVLTFVALLVTGYCGQSQWGHTKRSTAALAAGAEPTPAVAPGVVVPLA